MANVVIHSSTRMLFPVLGVFIVLVLSVGLYQYYRKTTAAAAAKARAAVLAKQAGEAESAWAEVLLHFDAGAYEQAADRFENSIRKPVRNLSQQRPDYAMPDAADPLTWLTRRESIYREHTGRATAILLDGLATGRVNPLRLDAWLQRHDYPELQQAGAAREEDILVARQAAATNWFRVFLEEEQRLPGLAPLVEDVYRGHWPDKHPMQLVFGPALSRAEQKATAKTLAVKTTLGYASFSVSPEDRLKDPDWQPPEVPILLTLSNRVVQGRADNSGPWDRAGPFHAYLNPPRVISKHFSGRILANYHRQLLKGIEEALEELPLHPLPASP